MQDANFAELNMLTTHVCTHKFIHTQTHKHTHTHTQAHTYTHIHRGEAGGFKLSVGTHNETVRHIVSWCDDLLPDSYLACFKCNMNQGPNRPLAHRSVTSQNAVYLKGSGDETRPSQLNKGLM